MLKLSKLCDYAGVIMAQMAREPSKPMAATEIAQHTGLPHPTVSKTLKLLLRAGLLHSRRGAQGGYLLASAPEHIRASDIIAAIEGPVAMTSCSHSDQQCDIAAHCQVSGNWQRVSRAIHELLESVTLAQLAHPEPLHLTPPRSVSLLATDAPRRERHFDG